MLASEVGALGLGDWGTAHASAVLRFSGLPREASVVSCQQYNLPVPVQQYTWGRLKSLYR